ncbi:MULTISPECIES: ABC transporter permease [Inquilinus]|uniref:Peptide/nickel transport system permease protein n=1 Tax=Inquilinus ginsengisoli TaxID=363840 RepID=A0ABU1JVE8_9PROT|nr:ABC transporter permease [Inquilinus ginsengisoli]MDR6292597.1 peptide/nickel transport system permease protein [Inquilinus ginsengisoli]
MVRLLTHRGFILGLALCLVFVGMALLSLVWTPYAPNAIAIPQKLQTPSALHWLGTDQLGRDTLSRLMVGARTSVAVGVVAVAIGLAAGLPLGLWAAARRGWTDEILGRAIDLTFAFPAILSAILITALLGPGAVNAILAIGIFNIAVFARVSRGAAMVVYGRDFVRAAQSLGRSRIDIALRHVLPNMANALIVQATIQFAIAILAEAALGYLGLGTQPPQASWGKMLLDAQTLLAQAPLQAVFPGLAIAVAVLGLNLIGDGLRDLMDPRMKVGRIG